MSIFSHHKKVEETVDVDQEESFSTAGVYGLEILHDADNAQVDIVFVHGLTGNRENTWTHKKSGVFWPKDLLPDDLEKARIITFGYDANIVSAIDTASSNTLRDHGKSLALDLVRRRTRSKSENRPLIFVAHSLGGLVVEQALLISRGAAQKYMKALLESTFGVMFMGTPHMGSDHAQWIKVLTKFVRMFRSANADIVRVLEPGSEMLANLQQEFHTMLEDRTRNQRKELEIFCFFEELGVRGIGEIVPRHSAILPRYLNEGIHGSHSEMTKFPSRASADYDRVSGQLLIWCLDIFSSSENDINAENKNEMRNRRVEKFAGGAGAGAGARDGGLGAGSGGAGRESLQQHHQQTWGATVNSPGGMVFQGNSGGDVSFGGGRGR